jgi:hypothetical protein
MTTFAVAPAQTAASPAGAIMAPSWSTPRPGKFFIANEYIPKKATANPLTMFTNSGTFVTSQ